MDACSPEFLVLHHEKGLTAYALERGRLVPMCSLPRAAGQWIAAGDLDGDGADELVITATRELHRYEWHHGALALTSISRFTSGSDTSPLLVIDMKIGDVNNDDTNELVLAAVPWMPTCRDTWRPGSATLSVCRWRDDSLLRLWTDGDRAGRAVWPSCGPRMVGVLDPRNSGWNELVMAGWSSDVSTTDFSEWCWTGNGLTQQGGFVLRDRRLQRMWTEERPMNSAVGAFSFRRIAGRTVLLAGIVQDLYVFQNELFTFVGDSLIQHRVLWSDEDHDYASPSSGILIDLDGKGIGAMRFMYPRDGRPRYEFYRL